MLNQLFAVDLFCFSGRNLLALAVLLKYPMDNAFRPPYSC